MKLNEEQIRNMVLAMKAQNIAPITLTTQKMVRLANAASPFGERFWMLQKVYRVETDNGSFVVRA